MKVLAIAATGMSAQQLNVEVIANNISNINTTSFKRARPEFTDLLYQTERSRGVPNRGGDGSIPEGASLGLGVRAAAIRNLHIQGAMTQTGNRLDLAIDGRGWFKVTAPEGRDALCPCRHLQHQCRWRHRHGRRLSARSGDPGPGRCGRRHRQRIRAGARQDPGRGAAAPAITDCP